MNSYHKPRHGRITACTSALLLSLVASTLPTKTYAQSQPPGAADQKDDSDTVIELPMFTVTSDKDRGYLSTNASSGTKLDQTIQQIPSTISVINEQLIRDTGAGSVQELLRYAPGVQTSGDKSENVQIRGFTLAVPLLDGFREPQGVPSEQVHIERVEVLEGPAGILYGNTFGLGGVVNRISKKPNFSVPVTELFLQVRGNDYYQGSLDFGRMAGKNFAYRIITDNVTSKDFQDFVDLHRVYVRPSIEWRPNTATRARLTLEYGDQTTHPEYNADFWNNITDNLVKLPQKFNPGEGTFREKTRRRALNFDVSHQIGRNWILRNSLQLTRQYEDKGGTSFGVVENGQFDGLSTLSGLFGSIISPDGSMVSLGSVPSDAFWLLRNPTLTNRLVQNYFDQIDIAGVFETGGLKHTLTFGLEATQDIDGYSLTYGFLPSIDISNINYQALASQYNNTGIMSALKVADLRTETVYWAGFLNDTVKMFHDKVALNIALRYDDYQQISSVAIAPGLPVPSTLTKFYAKPHYMPRGGVVYNFTPDVSAYIGYSEAYVINTNVDPDGKQARPEVGKEYEAGLKTILFGGRAMANFSAFQLQRENIVENDPTRPGYHRQVGSQQSKGLELSGIAVVTKNFQVMGSYAYTTGDTNESADATRIGLPLQAAPRHQAKGFGKYSFVDGPLKGFGFGAGFNFAAGRKVWTNKSISTREFQHIPDAIVWDAAAFYDLGKSLSLSINVRNVLNKSYYTGADETAWQRGTPREFIFSAHYKF